MKVGRSGWLWCAGAFTLLYAMVSLAVARSFALTLLGDISALALLLLATLLMAANAMSSREQTRIFWILAASGFAMWTATQAGWSYYELILRRDMPDPYFGDIILFLHVVPLMAAVAIRPHRRPAEGKLYFSTLNLLMLVAWWVFLYAFIVFPDEYVALNIPVYSPNYDLLYLLENLLLVAFFGIAAAASQGLWKKIYWNLFGAGGLYTIASVTINLAIGHGRYYTGSIYDMPLMVSLCWFVWVGLIAGHVQTGAEPHINNPVDAIVGYTDLLSDSESLNPEQLSMTRKIGQQARRTRDLVSDLLSFAQQNAAEKSLVDIGSLLHKAIQAEGLHLNQKIRVETKIERDLPRILGNANQLFQACTEIVSNAIDALEEVGGGTFAVAAFQHGGDEIVVEFSDTGRGLREPNKVFDPFYTTKPIGKGTGLGLSATYGVVQNHQGHITCYNKSEGGALFVVRLPVAKQATGAAPGNS